MSHFNCMGVVSVIPRPQTTSHMVLVRPRGDGCVNKIKREPKWSKSSPSVIMLETENGNEGTLHQREYKGKEKDCLTN